jgi:hypothetical protein
VRILHATKVGPQLEQVLGELRQRPEVRDDLFNGTPAWNVTLPVYLPERAPCAGATLVESDGRCHATSAMNTLEDRLASRH